MNVRVCGPNLRDDSKGTFHVHRADCEDLNRYGPGRMYGGDQYGTRESLVRNASIKSVVELCYADQIAENPDATWESYISDFWFAPCCSEGPYALPLEHEPHSQSEKVPAHKCELAVYAAIRTEHHQEDNVGDPAADIDIDQEVYLWFGKDAEKQATDYVMAQPIIKGDVRNVYWLLLRPNVLS
jgi:hypothetical protein